MYDRNESPPRPARDFRKQVQAMLLDASTQTLVQSANQRIRGCIMRGLRTLILAWIALSAAYSTSALAQQDRTWPRLRHRPGGLDPGDPLPLLTHLPALINK